MNKRRCAKSTIAGVLVAGVAIARVLQRSHDAGVLELAHRVDELQISAAWRLLVASRNAMPTGLARHVREFHEGLVQLDNAELVHVRRPSAATALTAQRCP